MSMTRDEVKQILFKSDPEFKKLYDEHRKYDAELQRLERVIYETSEDQITKKRLKKMKLHIKDQMEFKIQQYMNTKTSPGRVN